MALRVPRAPEADIGETAAPRPADARLAVRADPDAFGGQQARNATALAGALDVAQGELLEVKRRHDAAVVTDLYTQLRQRSSGLLDDPEEGLLRRRGREAGGITDAFGEKWTQLEQEVLAGAQDAEQRRALQRLAVRHRATLQARVRRHEVTEHERYVSEAQQAARLTALEDAARYADDPQAQEEAFGLGEASLRIEMAGSPPEAIERAVRDFRTKAHALAIERMLAEERPADAESYLGRVGAQLSPDAAAKMRRAVRRAREQAEREARTRALARILPRLEDDPARAASGLPVTEPLGFRDFAAAYGQDEARRRYERYRDALEFGELVSGVTGAGPEELQHILERARPDPEREGYADALRRFEKLQTAVRQEWQNRLKDPAAHVLEGNGAVAEMFAKAGENPETLQQAFEASLDEQGRLGVPAGRQRLLPQRQAKELVARVNGAATAQERLDALLPLAAGAGRYRERLLDELRAAGLPQGYGLAVSAALEGDLDRARRLAGLVETDLRLERDQRLDFESRLADSALAVEMQRLGLWSAATGDPSTLSRAGELRRLAEKAVAASLAEGLPMEEAVAGAERLVLGGRTPFVDEELGAVTLPPGIDAGMARTGLARMREHALAVPPSPELLDAVTGAFTDDPEPVAARKVQTVLQDLREAARFVEDEDGRWILVVPLPTETGVVWRRWSELAAGPEDLVGVLLQEAEE